LTSARLSFFAIIDHASTLASRPTCHTTLHLLTYRYQRAWERK
jgi:hypothetical protein